MKPGKIQVLAAVAPTANWCPLQMLTDKHRPVRYAQSKAKL